MLMMPTNTPTLFIKDNFSPKTILPAKTINIKFSTVKIEADFDKNSYFKENAQNIVPVK